MAKLYFIRHTKVADSNICYGRADVSLAPNYEAVWESLLELIRDLGIVPKQIYTSPSLRCKGLADFFVGNLETKPELYKDERLLEINFGDWEGLAWSDVPRSELDLWAAELLDYRFPAGENVNDLFVRCRKFLKDLAQTKPRDTFVVTHAGVIRCLLTLIDNRPPAKLLDYKIDYGSITTRLWPKNLPKQPK